MLLRKRQPKAQTTRGVQKRTTRRSTLKTREIKPLQQEQVKDILIAQVKTRSRSREKIKPRSQEKVKTRSQEKVKTRSRSRSRERVKQRSRSREATQNPRPSLRSPTDSNEVDFRRDPRFVGFELLKFDSWGDGRRRNEATISADKLLELNAHWWKTTPNETAMDREKNIAFPTNKLTSYTLREIGDPRVVKVNQNCISLEGQPSTVNGEDTRLDVQNNFDSYDVIQRGYAIILLPVRDALHFKENFEPPIPVGIMMEILKEDGSGYRYVHTNSIYKELAAGSENSVPITIKIFNGRSEVVTRTRMGYPDHIVDGFVHFSNSQKVWASDLAVVTLVTRDIGLNDYTHVIFDYLARGKASYYDAFIKPKTSSWELTGCLIDYFSKTKPKKRR
jgi:hypothetical protein